MNDTQLNPADLEAVEAEFMYRYQADARPATQQQLGIRTLRIAGGVAVSMRNDPTNYWNKALGFGFDEPITSDLIGELITFYRSNQARLGVLQLVTDRLPPDWDAIAEKHGLRAGGGIHKWAARAEDVRPGHSDLRIDRITPEQAEEWGTVIVTGHGMPREGLGDMMTAVATNPAFQAFGAWEGERMVSAAALLVRGPVASLNAGATLPEYRRRGAQSGLIAARAQAAATAGCAWVVAETGPQGSSLNNFGRAGLHTQYVRRNWIWEA